VAFSWDVAGEVEWLLARLGAGVDSVLEPFCGTGRMFPEFLTRGVAMTGVDLSEHMLRRARERVRSAGLMDAEFHAADAEGFELGRVFDGAICPINSFCYMRTNDAAARHLATIARHLRPGARYLVQVDLRAAEDLRLGEETPQGSWEMEHDGTRVRACWLVTDYDAATRLETHVTTFEAVAGPRTGEVVTSEDTARQWDHESWSRLLRDSRFEQTAAYDGNAADRASIPVDARLDGRALTWHELTIR